MVGAATPPSPSLIVFGVWVSESILAAVRTGALVALCLIAAIQDVRTHRISNAVAVSGLVAGLVLRSPLGLDAVISGALGAVLGLVLGAGFRALGALGGGDAKLVAAVGAFFGPGNLLGALLAIGTLGGIFAMIRLIRRGIVLPALHSTGRMVRFLLSFGREGELRAIEDPGAETLPYGLAIASGALVWWFWGPRFTGWLVGC